MILVTFHELSLEYHGWGDCNYDNVRLYDGYNATSPELAKVCTVIPPVITSSGSTVLVVFETDRTVNDGRFLLSWTFLNYSGEGR